MMRAAPPLFALLFLAFSLIGQAAGSTQSPPRAFSVHDLDRDGYLNREEYATLRARCQERLDSRGRSRCALMDFDALDTDRDGRIGEEELLHAISRQGHGARHGWHGQDHVDSPISETLPSR
jgi:hypothetical protein